MSSNSRKSQTDEEFERAAKLQRLCEAAMTDFTEQLLSFSVAKLRHLRVALSVSDRYGLQVDAILLYYELHSHRWQEFVARFYAKQGEFFTMANEPSLKGLYRNSCRGSKLTFAHCFHISKYYIDEFSSYLHWQIAKNGRYPPTQNGDIRSLLALFRQKSLQN